MPAARASSSPLPRAHTDRAALAQGVCVPCIASPRLAGSSAERQNTKYRSFRGRGLTQGNKNPPGGQPEQQTPALFYYPLRQGIIGPLGLGSCSRLSLLLKSQQPVNVSLTCHRFGSPILSRTQFHAQSSKSDIHRREIAHLPHPCDPLSTLPTTLFFFLGPETATARARRATSTRHQRPVRLLAPRSRSVPRPLRRRTAARSARPSSCLGFAGVSASDKSRRRREAQSTLALGPGRLF